MKLLCSLLAALVAFASAQTCTNPQATRQVFGQYLQCVKRDLTSRYGEFEQEFQEHTKAAAWKCFAPSIREANQRNRCVLSLRDLDAFAWDSSGPMRDCKFCLTFARAAIKAMKQMTEQQMQCMRRVMTDAVTKEANACIRPRVRNFAGVPDLPDFEEGAFRFKDQIMRSVSDHVWIQSRLAFCGDRNQGRAAATKRCLANPPIPGYLAKHCALDKNCERNIPGDCKQIANDVGDATCACMDIAREELKSRIGNIANTIRDTIDSRSRSVGIGGGTVLDNCVNNIRAQLVTPQNDWLDVINKATSQCLQGSGIGSSFGGALSGGGKLDITSLMRIGCRKIITDRSVGNSQAHEQLEIGFSFINNVIDAMVGRAKRFCGGPYCNAAPRRG